MTPAQKVIIRTWSEEQDWWDKLSGQAWERARRALGRNVSGTAVYEPAVCSTALRLGLAPRQVHNALEAGDVKSYDKGAV